jgi:hypothetical protein
VALAKNGPAPPVERARALAARLELALVLGEQTRARTLRAELQEVSLTEEERARIRRELDAVDALERSQP